MKKYFIYADATTEAIQAYNIRYLNNLLSLLKNGVIKLNKFLVKANKMKTPEAVKKIKELIVDFNNVSENINKSNILQDIKKLDKELQTQIQFDLKRIRGEVPRIPNFDFRIHDEAGLSEEYWAREKAKYERMKERLRERDKKIWGNKNV